MERERDESREEGYIGDRRRKKNKVVRGDKKQDKKIERRENRFRGDEERRKEERRGKRTKKEKTRSLEGRRLDERRQQK